MTELTGFGQSHVIAVQQLWKFPPRCDRTGRPLTVCLFGMSDPAKGSANVLSNCSLAKGASLNLARFTFVHRHRY